MDPKAKDPKAKDPQERFTGNFEDDFALVGENEDDDEETDDK